MRENAARPRRILAISSGGGHWIQLLRLRPAFEGHRVVWATVKPGSRGDVGEDDFVTVTDATRWSRWSLVRLVLEVLWLVLRLRPDVVVTTGAAPGFFAVMFGRILGRRTVWIDSIANVERMSLSGARAGRFAHLWLTQWAHLAASGGPEHRGAVF